MPCTYGSHLRVPATLLDMARVQADLTVFNQDYHKNQAMGFQPKAGDVPFLRLYEEDGEHVILPRGYLRFVPNVSLVDVRPHWDRVDGFTFIGKLRTKQFRATQALVDNPGDKLFCLGCGKGKTIMSLWYAAAKGVKTLVIVDRDFLLDQWLMAIEKVLHLTDGPGVIKGKNQTIGEQITIASIKTLSLYEFEPEFYDQFGLIIADEGHMLGAPEASKVLPCFPGERLILTATPERRDGMHPVFMMHAGGMEPVYTDLTRENSSYWNFVEIPDVVDPAKLGKKKLYRKMPGRPRPFFQRSTYETAAGQSMEFNAQILYEVFQAERTGRNILVLGSRTEQLELLCNAAKDEGVDASLVTSWVKGRNRNDAFASRVIFATWQIAGRALDIDRLDTLVLLYPTDDEGFLRQAVGRVEQRDSAKDRKSVVVCFTHTAHQSLVRKSDQMRLAVREIDPGAVIKTVKRECLLQKLSSFEEQRKRNTLDGVPRFGTRPTLSPIHKALPRP